MNRFKQFLRDESGTATVEYTVLTAVTIGMAVASTTIIKDGAASAGQDMQEELSTSNNAYEIEVQTVYDAEFLATARYAMEGFSLDEMKTVTAFMDDMLAAFAEMEQDILSQGEIEMISDFDVAVDMTWIDMGLNRPTGGTWTEAELAALPGEFEVLAYTN